MLETKNIVQLGKWRFEGPSSWQHLSSRQYLQWVRWHLLGAPDAGWYVLLGAWFKIRYRHLRKLTAQQRVFLLDEVFAWLVERPSRWMIPSVWIWCRRYRGPGDRLQHLSFGEFMFAESARNDLSVEPNRAQLAELAAAIYRPYQKGQPGKRAPFIKAQLDSQINRFSRLPVATLEAIRINYFGCIDQLPDRFAYLYPKQASSDEPGSWLDVGLSLARQTGALGTFHQMEETNVYLVLSVLNDVLREQVELEAKLKES